MIVALLLQAATAPPADIVVVAHKRRCGVQLKGVDLTNRELDRYAGVWAAGQEVRIHVGPGASNRCLAKIVFRLANRGVTRTTFVDAPPGEQ